MTKWVVHKKPQLPAAMSYAGPTWLHIRIRSGMKYKPQYEDYAYALRIAEALSEFNPVGFTVSEAVGEDIGRDVR